MSEYPDFAPWLPDLEAAPSAKNRNDPALDWTEAFRGIKHAWTSPSVDIADNLKTRPTIRRGWGTTPLDVKQVYAIAQRIDALSRRIVELEGAGPVLDQSALDEYAAKHAVRSGTLVTDANADWYALYDEGGNLIEQGDLGDLPLVGDLGSWALVKIDANGLLDWGQVFPTTLDAIERLAGKQP